MKNIIQKARAAHRAAVEMLYEDTCSIYERKPVRDEATKITKQQEVLVQESLPCKLSFESLDTTSMEDGAAKQTVSVKLFLTPDIPVREGSKLLIVHQGAETAYQRSGIPAVYATHQEVMLEPFERWA